MSVELRNAALDRLTAAGFDVEGVRVVVDHPGRSTFEALVDGQRCAVKAEPDRAIATREVGATLWASEVGVSAPEVVFSDDDGSVAVLAVTWLEGRSLSEDARPENWSAAGAALRSVHESPVPAGAHSFSDGLPWWEFFERWTTREASLAVEFGALDAPTAALASSWLLDWLTGRPEPAMTFMHGDLQPAHVILGPRGASLIDWGDASIGDPAWDLAVLLLDHPHHVDDVLAGYGPSADFAERFDAYRLLRHLGAINWLVEFGFDPTESVDALCTQLRG